MNDGNEIFRYLKRALVPGGTAPIVRIGFHDGISGSAFFDKAFIDSAIDELQRRLQAHCVDPVTPLETLMMHLLMSSAYVSKDATAAIESQRAFEARDPESDQAR